LLTGFHLPAQNPYIQHYTTSDGLSSNTVYYVYQDSKKFIWFATDAGVVRYDGTTFTNYRKKDGLSSNEVVRIKEDSFGRIWFFNLNGRLDFFFRNRIFNETDFPVLKSIKNRNFFTDFFQDKDSVIYFYNWASEIFALSPRNAVKECEIYREFLKYQHEKLSGDLSLRYLDRDSRGGFRLWTRTGVFRVNSSFEKPVMLFDSVDICSVFQNRDACFYIFAYDKGVFRVTGNFHAEGVSIPVKMNLGYRGIKSILEDLDGFLWIVTFDNGVFCLRNNQVVHHFEIKTGQAIIQDNENNIWISSMKDGIYKISPNINVHTHYENTFFQNAGITAMYARRGWGIWLTNGKTIYLLKTRKFYTLDFRKENININVLCQFKNNKMIAGESGLSFFIFEKIDRVPVNKKIRFRLSSNNDHIPIKPGGTNKNVTLKKVSINKTGDMVCSFQGGSLLRFNINSHFRDVIETLLGEHIYNVFFNVNDEIIINATKNYLFRNNKFSPDNELSHFDSKIITDHLILNPATELYNIDGDTIFLYNQLRFFNLTAAFGSPFDLQIKKVAYEAPSLYLATYRNIYRCDDPLNLLKNKPVHLQLMDVNFRNIQDILVFDDSLYIASDDGLTVIPEALFNKNKTITPIPYFQSILVNDKESLLPGQDLVLEGNSKIIINFSCVNYSSTPIVYSYRLIGMDTAWTNAASGNVIYQVLKHGKYTFQLRVRKPSAAWSPAVECRITVNILFWQHPLFLGSLFVLCMGLMIFIIIRRKNNQIRRRETDSQLITLEQKALQSMMNPHFIFNSLGSIQNYLLQKKSGEAGLYLSQFARLIRQNLNAINAASINLEEEIDRLKNYLDLEKLRTENIFEYTIDVDENVEADDVQIPSMIIQPFVENAIWHGISSLKEPGSVRIEFRKADETSMKIIIQDNGVGMKKSQTYSSESEKHIHMGIEMTRRRLELLGMKYSVDTSIDFYEASSGLPNPGTRIVLVVPVSFGESEL
jgi:two-component sensor histidine kinase